MDHALVDSGAFAQVAAAPRRRGAGRLLALPLALLAALSLLVAEAAVALWGDAAVEPEGSPDMEFGPADGRPLTCVVLGDSSGAGSGAESHDLAFPRLCARALALRTGRRVKLHVLAVSASRVRDVLHKQVSHVAALQPDLVLLVVGGNDINHVSSLRSVRRDLGTVLDQLAATGAKVVVSSVPAMGAAVRIAQPLRSLAGIASVIYDRVWKEETLRRGMTYAPMREELGAIFHADPLLLSFDGFHPSARGYALWAKFFNRYIEQANPI